MWEVEMRLHLHSVWMQSLHGHWNQVGWEPGYHRSQLVGLEMDGIMVDAMLPAESQGILTPLLLFIENLFLSNFDNNKRNHLQIIMTLCSYSGASGF